MQTQNELMNAHIRKDQADAALKKTEAALTQLAAQNLRASTNNLKTAKLGLERAKNSVWQSIPLSTSQQVQNTDSGTRREQQKQMMERQGQKKTATKAQVNIIKQSIGVAKAQSHQEAAKARKQHLEEQTDQSKAKASVKAKIARVMTKAASVANSKETPAELQDVVQRLQKYLKKVIGDDLHTITFRF